MQTLWHLNSLVPLEEPSSFEEAHYAGLKEWENAMKEEISAWTLKKNETWELVPLPEGVKPIELSPSV